MKNNSERWKLAEDLAFEHVAPSIIVCGNAEAVSDEGAASVIHCHLNLNLIFSFHVFVMLRSEHLFYQ